MIDPREATRAVVLARGLGTRMREADAGAGLAPEQAAVAATGVKAMIPIDRPFLDYVLSALADAGFREVCLVIGPEHDAIREHYTRTVRPRRVAVRFAVQDEPRGTADAVLAAEPFTGGEPFVVINSDNFYPPAALAALRSTPGAALAGFGRDALLAGNVAPERIRGFALLDVAPDGTLRRIVEKPDEATERALGADALVSMNCWRFTGEIFEACRRIAPSPRGELEIPAAVELAMRELGVRFRVVPVHEPVLDLSRRADVPAVAERLRGRRVEL